MCVCVCVCVCVCDGEREGGREYLTFCFILIDLNCNRDLSEQINLFTDALQMIARGGSNRRDREGEKRRKKKRRKIRRRKVYYGGESGK